ncbi:MAG: hypothetical protein GX344_04095 [Intrasporangiaceae bacterium]|nr:hypothetical protein [Intrasporangiaceae bacterium]
MLERQDPHLVARLELTDRRPGGLHVRDAVQPDELLVRGDLHRRDAPETVTREQHRVPLTEPAAGRLRLGECPQCRPCQDGGLVDHRHEVGGAVMRDRSGNRAERDRPGDLDDPGRAAVRLRHLDDPHDGLAADERLGRHEGGDVVDVDDRAVRDLSQPGQVHGAVLEPADSPAAPADDSHEGAGDGPCGVGAQLRLTLDKRIAGSGCPGAPSQASGEGCCRHQAVPGVGERMDELPEGVPHHPAHLTGQHRAQLVPTQSPGGVRDVVRALVEDPRCRRQPVDRHGRAADPATDLELSHRRHGGAWPRAG